MTAAMNAPLPAARPHSGPPRRHVIPGVALWAILAAHSLNALPCLAGETQPCVRVLVTASKDPDHSAMIGRARPLLDSLGRANHFCIDFRLGTEFITDSVLAGYQVLLQLQQAPFELTPAQQRAFERFVEQRKGWVGIHAAGLTGRQFIDTSTAYWSWFEDFFGGIVYSPHPALQRGTVCVEDRTHPVTRNLPASFTITDEWYEFNKSPRGRVRVLATADESTYRQNVPMGDHPMVWTNEHYDRMIYIGIGHHVSAWDTPAFVTLVRDAILWAATPTLQTVDIDEPAVHVNQVAYEAHGPKAAVAAVQGPPLRAVPFRVVNVITGATVYTGFSTPAESVPDWTERQRFYRLDFSHYTGQGRFRIDVDSGRTGLRSPEFTIADDALATITVPAVVRYFSRQRANTPEELAADRALPVFGSSDSVDMRGGWCDAGGDVSKYFSHLAYANVMSPQQTPLAAWSLAAAAESGRLTDGRASLKDSLVDEALWGADYLVRALSPEGYFRMIVFSYFDKNPHARRVVGLRANSVTTPEYQCAFREGGGMAIAALARISRWTRHGSFTSRQYAGAAQRAFRHLLTFNTRYDDDGKENIIDDYCALMAATELWIACDSALYRDEARRRAQALCRRLTPGGWFVADDSGRPFYHASDAGLPIVALARYLSREHAPAERAEALRTIRQALKSTLRAAGEVVNPFGVARQTYRVGNTIRNGFFMPHENETGWWWQGENARLGSLAAAALIGRRLAASGPADRPFADSLSLFAARQISWILGCNPYSMCFLFQFGSRNVPPMRSQFGHGSERGGISNGITGGEGRADGSGIDFRLRDGGNEWRWTEQWLPHAAWYLQAVTAMVESREVPPGEGNGQR